MAGHLKQKVKRNAKLEERDEEVDPDTFLFDDDDDDLDDDSDLPPERELNEDDGVLDDDWD
jgi:hypothetical protein